MTDLDDVLGVDEAAEAAGKSSVAVRKALQRGSLRGKKVGRDWVTTREDVLAWLAWRPVDRRNAKGRYDRRIM